MCINISTFMEQKRTTLCTYLFISIWVAHMCTLGECVCPQLVLTGAWQSTHKQTKTEQTTHPINHMHCTYYI